MKPFDQPHGLCCIDPVSLAALGTAISGLVGGGTAAAAGAAGGAAAGAAAGGAAAAGGGIGLGTALGLGGAAAGAGLAAGELLDRNSASTAAPSPPPDPAAPIQQPTGSQKSGTTGNQPSFVGAAAAPSQVGYGQKSLLGQ